MRRRPSEKHQAIWDLPINQLEEPERDTTLKIPNKILAEDVKRKVESVLMMRMVFEMITKIMLVMLTKSF